MASVIQGTCPHGKVLFACVNEPKLLKEYADEIAEMVAAGFKIERLDKLVTFDGGCDACNAERKESNQQQVEMFG